MEIPKPDLEHLHWAAWARLPGVGPRRVERLLACFGSLEAAWRAPAERLAACRAWPTGALAGVLAARAGLDPAAALRHDMARGYRVLARPTPGYPAALLDLADPPPVLWLRGDLALPERAVAVVGARAASPYGLRQARRLGTELAEAGVLVVSGAAAGVDRAAHEGALAAGPTLAVLGCGGEHVYPAHHVGLYRAIAARGALLSELPPEARPRPGHFPRRNRLIAALGRATVVVEARARSGSLITAGLAAELGREVLAVPGPVGEPGSEGPHGLLRDGAGLVEGAADVFAACGWPAPGRPAPAPAHPPEAQALLAALGAEALAFDTLAARTGLGPATLAARLTALELAGAVRALPGGIYARG
ncbi:MAG: DNA-processing protein DprA [Candidatus Sericytochromatia bacterium]|nr:DNA-processing protein DprA [Candidatus Sericytochromatia bacterium]